MIGNFVQFRNEKELKKFAKPEGNGQRVLFFIYVVYIFFRKTFICEKKIYS